MEFFFLQGQMLDEPPPRSLLYGEGVFETFRWAGKAPVFLGKHLKRMREGAELLRIPPPREDEFRSAVEEAVKKSGIGDARVKVCLLSQGPQQFSANPERRVLLLVVSPYQPPKSVVAVHVVSFKRNSASPLLRIKSTSYLENVLGRREAEKLGFDEGIFLNERGELTEGCATNLFWIRGEILYTPALECGLLPGITRELLISLAPELGLRVEEGRYGLKSLLRAETALLTNSLIGAVGINRVEKIQIPVDEGLLARIQRALFQELGWKPSL
jgi:4-amino-4-deoxychorismate lyase